MAKDAINAGHIKINEEKIKPSRKVGINQLISIKHSGGEKIIVVLALSSKRKGACEVQKLYAETDTSQKTRQKLVTEVKMSLLSNPIATKPSKKQRRQIHQFLQIR
tara:strand:- start:33534 stop:33851 length:318 start_codon:yes stop_codon:yes gene_type:complete